MWDMLTKIYAMIMPTVINVVRYAKVTMVKNGQTQTLQVATVGDEIIDNVKFIEPFGLAVFPLLGSEAIIVNINGDSNNTAAVTVARRELRPQDLNPGEVTLWDASGNRINLKNGGIIEIIAPASTKIITKIASIEADTATIKAKNVNLGNVGGLEVATKGCLVGVNPATGRTEVLEGSNVVKATL